MRIAGLVILSLMLVSCVVPEPTPESGSIAFLQSVMTYKTDLLFFVKEDVLAPSTAVLISADGRTVLRYPRLLSFTHGIFVFFNIPPGDYTVSEIVFTRGEDESAQEIKVRFERDEAQSSRIRVGRNEVAYLGSYHIISREGKIDLIDNIENEAGVLLLVLDFLRESPWETIIKKRLEFLR